MIGAIGANATTFFQRPFAETVENAPNIVRGVVGPSHADWATAEDGTRRIYTFTELKLTEVFKGNVPASDLVFREIGGVRDGIGLEVSGAARFRIGEEVVLFLFPKNSDGTFDLKGMMMGKLTIKKDSETGEEVLSGPAIGGSTHPSLRGHEHEVQNGLPDGGKWTLAAFRRLVLPGGGASARPQEGAGLAIPKQKSTVIPIVENRPVAVAAAPGLQSLTSEATGPSTTRQFLLGGLGLVILFGLAMTITKSLRGKNK